VVKRDGRRDEFSREKVLAGIHRSCAKLQVTSAEIAAIAEDIESALHSRGVQEVPSSEIGDMVMERLRELSDVAYVRFAAHYRRFQEIDEFQQELSRARSTPRRPARRAGAAQPPLLPPTEMSRVQEQETRNREQGRKLDAGNGKQREEDPGQGAAMEGVVTSITERRRRAGGAR
jgi:hypothetical protein